MKNKQDLSMLRQFFGEQPFNKKYTAEELYNVFEVFVPLMTKEQQEELVEALKRI